MKAVPKGQEQQAAERIAKQNEKYHPGMEILQVSWPRWVKGNKNNGIPKLYSSLLVELTTPKTANKVIEREMVEGY